ncbi:MAG: PD-(D/E)XK nuclease-like domain-containing protein [Rhodospirillaceae bacterium]
MLERTDAVNWSTLKYMRQSPKHYRHALTVERTTTDAMMLGLVAHCAVYEPQELAARYVRMPNFHGGMKDETAIAKGYAGGKEAKAAWVAENEGAMLVPDDIYERAIACAEAVLSDSVSSSMVQGGASEQLITWTDERTGIECRGRFDHVNGRLSDLKTTRASGIRAFTRDAAEYGYHAQLAFYTDGLRANGIDPQGAPAIIAVESAPPHDVIVFTLDKPTLAAGRRVYRDCLDTLRICREADMWPGVTSGAAIALELPPWATEAEEITLGGVNLF